MTDSAAQTFDTVRHFDAEKALASDEVIPRVIPGYDRLHFLASNILQTEISGRGRVFVVGAGTGRESITLCRDNPSLSVVGCDPSAHMLAIARQRVAEEGLENRIELQQGEAGDLPEQPGFQAAAMILVMHFIADDGGKEKLLDAIALRLKPGAPLVLADMFGERDGPEFKAQEGVWRSMQIAAGVDPEDVDKSIRHAAKDTYPISENRLCQLLDGAGFEPPTPFFRSLMFGGWVTRKKAPGVRSFQIPSI